jgi:hypothetical protein
VRWLLVVLAACGRVGFDPLGAAELPVCTAGAVELCDGIDNNCDDIIDEGCPCTERVDSLGIYGYTVGIAWSGAGYGIVQLDGIDESALFMYVDERGKSPPIELPIMPMPPGSVRANTAVGIVWTGTRFVAVLQDIADGKVRLITHGVRTDGTIDGTTVLANMGGNPVLAPLAGGLVVVYYASSTATSAIVVDERGAVVREVTLQFPAAVFPDAAAASETEVVVSSSSELFEPSQLSVARFDSTTGAAIGAPLAVGSGQTTNQHAIAWNGTSFAIMWIEQSGAVMFAELLDGVLGVPVTLDSGQVGYPALAWNGTSYVAAYQRYNLTDFRAVTVVTRLSASGQRMSPDRTYTNESSGELFPFTRVAAADRRAAVVYPVSVESQNSYFVAQLCQ